MKTTLRVLLVLVALGTFALPQPVQACGMTCKLIPTPTNPYCFRCVEDETSTHGCEERYPCGCAFVDCGWADAGRPASSLEEIGIPEKPLSCPVMPAGAEDQVWAAIAAT